jgi:hypothetical protein
MDRRALLEAGGLTVAAGFGLFVGFPNVFGARGFPWAHHDVTLTNLDRRAHEVRITATRRSPAGETTPYDETVDLSPATGVTDAAADREVDGVPVATTTRDVTRVSGMHDLTVSVGLSAVAASLGAPGGFDGPETVLVVSGAMCVGALGSRRLSAWVRADSGR